MALHKSLQEPFPYDASTKAKTATAVFFGLFILVFLLMFQPFELNKLPTNQLIIIALIYSAITFICVFTITALMPVFFPNSFNEKVWTGTKQLLFIAAIIFVVGVVNFLLSPYLVDTSLTLKRAVWFQGITMAVGLPPITIFVLVRQNQLLQKFRNEARVIEEKLKQKIENETSATTPTSLPNARVLFTSDNKSDELDLNTDDLYMITSANNYIKVYHRQENRVVYSIVRSTIKKAEDSTVAHPNLFKCHRAFIINLDKVNHVEGNAQGYKLRIEGYDEVVPVSRNLSAEFSDKLLAHRQRYGRN